MIEGIPDGWDQERVGQIHPGEYCLNNYGDPERWNADQPSISKNYVVIRKIEKPKKYRPFANAAEFGVYWGKPVRSKSEAAVDSLSAVVFAGRLTVDVVFPDSVRTMKYAEAFDILIFTDGTPFGIEVTE